MNKIIVKELLKIARDIISPEVDVWRIHFPYQLKDEIEREYKRLSNLFNGVSKKQPEIRKKLHLILGSMVTLLARVGGVESSLYRKATVECVAKFEVDDVKDVIGRGIGKMERVQDEYNKIGKEMKNSSDPVIEKSYKEYKKVKKSFEDVMQNMVDLEGILWNE